VPNQKKNESSPTKRGCMPPKTTRETASSVVARPPAERGLTKFETLSCERWTEEWGDYPAEGHIHVGYIDARSFDHQARYHVTLGVDADSSRLIDVPSWIWSAAGPPGPFKSHDETSRSLRRRAESKLAHEKPAY
jgi:hypothetical protein